MSTVTVTRAGLEFEVTELGPPDGEPVVLLHGFPQHSNCWDGLTPLLTAAGYRTLAMNQRGYSPRARPVHRRDYRITELVADVLALIEDGAGGGPVHLVGHDWGAVVAWALTVSHPDRVASLTALSVPHGGAFLSAMFTSVQVVKSWYMFAFQIPWLPERLLHRNGARILARLGQAGATARRDAARFPEPAALSGALNWYRAMPLIDPRAAGLPATRPTQLAELLLPHLQRWSTQTPRTRTRPFAEAGQRTRP